MDYPSTVAQRHAGMAAFRSQMLAAHERMLASGKLSKRDADYTRTLVATIKAAQIKHGEVL